MEDLINDWLHPPELAKRRGLGELLTCLPDLLGEQIVPEGAISREPLDRASPPAEVSPMSVWVFCVLASLAMVQDLTFSKLIVGEKGVSARDSSRASRQDRSYWRGQRRR